MSQVNNLLAAQILQKPADQENENYLEMSIIVKHVWSEIRE
jgi:hypothetical protein